MVSFIESAEKRYGREARQRLVRIFAAAGLPDAAYGEYLKGTEANFLFLNRYGLVIRAGYRLPVPEHDLVLQPLSQTAPFGNGMYAIELMPGINGGVSGFEADLLHAALAADGVDFHDDLKQNCGHIQADLPGFPQGVPVVLDRGAVSPINYFFSNARNPRVSTQVLRETFNRSAMAGFQAEFYRPLRESLQKAWPDMAPPDRTRLREFLGLCAAEINKMEKGEPALLSNRWMTEEATCDKARKVVQVAARYDRKL